MIDRKQQVPCTNKVVKGVAIDRLPEALNASYRGVHARHLQGSREADR